MSVREEQELASRRQKLETWRQLGYQMYPAVFKRTRTSTEVVTMAAGGVATLEGSELPVGEGVSVAGRLLTLRPHGQLWFATLQDQAGEIQLAAVATAVEKKLWQLILALDRGDIVGVDGIVVRTKKGEPTIFVKKLIPLAKALLPLPEKWHGLKDVEQRLRRRYVDLMMSAETRQLFVKKSNFWRTVRGHLAGAGFLEVDTPALEAVAGGADANPFITHHDALDQDFYLRISLELPLKRLLVGGFEKVFEIARCFRNEGIDYSHNPEFTQIEFYWAYKNYEDLMKEMEVFLEKLVKEINGSATAEYDGQTIDFTGPYPKLDFREALLKATGLDLDEHDDKSLRKEAKNKGLKVESFWGKGKLADELFKEFVRPKMINPTYIINHPVELSPLAKKIEGRQNYVERFQLIVAGRFELMNAFSELNDPLEQAERFKQQQRLAGQGDQEAMGKDDELVEALKYGLPPVAGLGMGLDRLANVLTNTHNIREVILFPTLKPDAEIKK